MCAHGSSLLCSYLLYIDFPFLPIASFSQPSCSSYFFNQFILSFFLLYYLLTLNCILCYFPHSFITYLLQTWSFTTYSFTTYLFWAWSFVQVLAPSPLAYFKFNILLLILFKVVRNDVMRPSCVRHHINVHLNVSISFIRSNIDILFIIDQKILIISKSSNQ
jgi:hypothetical protein